MKIRFAIAGFLASFTAASLLPVSCASSAGTGGSPDKAGIEQAAAVSEPVIKVQTGHTWNIKCMAISPDGRHLFTSSDDTLIKVWDTASGKELHSYAGHLAAVSDIALSPDGKNLVSAGLWEHSVRYWDLARGVTLRTAELSSPVRAVAVSPDATYAIVGEESGVISRWDFRSGARTPVGQIAGAGVTDIAFAPDGKSFASVSADGAVRLWPASAIISVSRTIGRHAGKALCVVFSPDGTRIAAGGDDHAVRLWDVRTGTEAGIFEKPGAVFSSLAFLPGTDEIISASLDNMVYSMNFVSGRSKLVFGGSRDRPEPWTCLAVSSDGSAIYAGGDWSTLRAWSVEASRLRYDVTNREKLMGLSLVGDHGLMIAAMRSGATILDLDEVRLRPARTPRGQAVRLVAPSGETTIALSSADSSNAISLVDTSDGVVRATLTGMEGTVWCSAVSAGTSHVAAADDTGPVFLWNIQRPRAPLKLEAERNNRTWPVFSPDGKVLVCACNQKVKFWDTETGKLLRSVTCEQWATSVAFSQDGETLFFGTGDGSIEVRSRDGSLRRTLRDPKRGSGVPALLLTPDGKGLYSGSNDRIIRRWDLSSGAVTARYVGHTGKTLSIRLSRDGTRLFSLGQDDTVKVWNAASQELLYSVIMDEGGEYLAWTPEGYYTGSALIAQDRLYVQNGEEISSIEQYNELLFRPDLVAAKGRDGVLADAVRTASAPKILARDGLPPLVRILGPDDGNLSARDVTLKLRVIERSGGIGRVVISLDGMPVVLSEAGRGLSVVAATDASPAASASGTVMEVRVSLRGGENLVEVSASNKAGTIESPRDSRRYTVPETSSGKPKLVMLLVAVQQYRDGALRLAHSVEDAIGFQASMSKSSGSLYKEVRVTRLFDAEVTRKGFDAAFTSLAGTVKPEDVFVLYFAGHGVANDADGEYYFLPVDFRYKDRTSIVQQGISKKEILDDLVKIKAEKSILFFDTCNSGSFLEAARSRGLTEKTAVDRLKRAIGRVMIVASSNTQVALEGYKGHGVFTYVLMDGIAGKADSDRNGFVSVKELSIYVESVVPEITYSTWGYEQVPQSLLPREDFPLVQAGGSPTGSK